MRFPGSGRQRGCGPRRPVAVTRRAAVNADPAADLGCETASPLRSCLAIPLGAGDEPAGVLALYRGEANAFTDNHVRLLELLAARVEAPLVAAMASDEHEATLQPAGPLTLLRRGSRV